MEHIFSFKPPQPQKDEFHNVYPFLLHSFYSSFHISWALERWDRCMSITQVKGWVLDLDDIETVSLSIWLVINLHSCCQPLENKLSWPRFAAAINYRYGSTCLELNWTVMPYTLSYHIAFTLGPMNSSAIIFYTCLQYKIWSTFHEVSLKSNRKTIGCTPKSHVTIPPVS